MSSTKKISSRKDQDKNTNNKSKNNARLSDKSMSFSGHAAEDMFVGKLRRPKTVPDLVSNVSSMDMLRPKLTKLLLKVTVQRSLGPVQVIISPNSSVRDLVADALRQYSKEGRRPILSSLDPSDFGLHYSQFSLQSLEADEKLIDLGSRNFFLCPKQTAAAARSGDDDGGISFEHGTTTTTSSTCSNEVERVTKISAGWPRLFMNFL
ncbi:hypothetical protein Tco_0360763 [Tanacetum coccineum]